MLWDRPSLSLALDAEDVWGVVIRRGLRRTTLGEAAREPLPPGALVPSPLGSNVARPAELAEALRSLCRRLGLGAGRRAHLILPAGVARPLLLDTGAGPREPADLRFRLASALAYPATEAVIGTIRVARSRLLAAAVRRSVVAEYEALVRAAGLEPGRVELAPLVAYSALMARPLPARAMDVVLGNAALSMARWEHQSLASVRTRLRCMTHDDTGWLVDEIERAARPVSGAGSSALRLSGAGATALAERLRERGHETRLAWQLPEAPQGMEAAELSWLGGVLR